MKSVLLVITLLVGALVPVATAADLPTPRPSVSMLEIAMPAEATAGDVFAVEVASDPGAAVTVVFTNGYRTTASEITLTATTGRLVVPFSEHAGLLEAFAISGGRTAVATTQIRPGRIAAPVPLVGARSIVADGFDRAMVVVIPADDFGNPAPAGSRVEISVVHPDRSAITAAATVARTLGWIWVPSVTTAGVAVVTTASTPGTDRAIIEVPAPPTEFDLTIETELRHADGVTLVTVASDVLTDPHGNRSLDGTAALVRAEYPDGTVSMQTVVTVGGVARALIEAPTAAGVISVEMLVQGTMSRPLEVAFDAGPVTATTTTAHMTAATVRPTGGGR